MASTPVRINRRSTASILDVSIKVDIFILDCETLLVIFLLLAVRCFKLVHFFFSKTCRLLRKGLCLRLAMSKKESELSPLFTHRQDGRSRDTSRSGVEKGLFLSLYIFF